MTPLPPEPPEEDRIRPHVYDGIQEFDKRLPNWWLYTLYVTIVFWVGYWAYFEWFRAGPTSAQEVGAELARIEAARLATAQMDDPTLWQMSRNPAVTTAGRAVYDANCGACHLASLRGKAESPIAIGPDLTDNVWVYGGRPVEVHALITKGVLAKGMPTWGPVLGPRKISEVTAFLLSRHREGDPIVLQPPSTP
jgi:cytochrome c oxidase cbb3-type subunit 3